MLFLCRRTTLNFTYNEGLREFRSEHYRAAMASFALASKVDATFAPAWDYLARSEYRLGLAKEAEKHWRQALAMRPDMVEAKIGLSNILAKRGEYQDAMKLLRKALHLSPTNLSAYSNLADVQWRMGNHEDALQSISRVIDLDSGNLRARASRARMYLKCGDLHSAEQDIDQCLSAGIRPRLQSDEDFFDFVRAEVAAATGDTTTAQLLVARLAPTYGKDANFKALRSRLNHDSQPGSTSK
jgi:tetratricopeptide (TPR) repeat protein